MIRKNREQDNLSSWVNLKTLNMFSRQSTLINMTLDKQEQSLMINSYGCLTAFFYKTLLQHVDKN